MGAGFVDEVVPVAGTEALKLEDELINRSIAWARKNLSL